MRAALLTEYGDVDKLEIRDVREPEPGPERGKSPRCRVEHQPNRLLCDAIAVG